MTLPKDPIKAAEYRKKLSEMMKERYVTEVHPMYGKTHTPEARKKISERLKGKGSGEKNPMFGKKHSPETRIKLRESHIGIQAGPNHPMFGKHHSPEAKEKMRLRKLGRKLPPEQRKKIGDAIRGEKHPQWEGGISFAPYCQKFNAEFKERVREFFGRRCVLCGKGELREKHLVHHVNYDKMVCCNDVKPLFVPLCRGCHAKTNFNREYWEQYFTDLIQNQYNGECYLPAQKIESVPL